MTEENTKEEGTECRKKVEWAEYIFDPKDTDGWLPHLEKEGYCVLKSVLSLKSVNEIIDMIWEDMEKLFGAQRGDFTTWGNIPNGTAGIVSKGLPQTRGPWQARGNENIREVFRQIWETDDLLVSMDSVLCWLPWWLNSNWKPFTGWYSDFHLLQYYKVSLRGVAFGPKSLCEAGTRLCTGHGTTVRRN